MDLDLYCSFCTQSTLKALALNPLFISTTITLVMVSYMYCHSCRVRGRLMDAWQPICAHVCVSIESLYLFILTQCKLGLFRCIHL